MITRLSSLALNADVLGSSPSGTKYNYLFFLFFCVSMRYAIELEGVCICSGISCPSNCEIGLD